jgi:hypothetical protein
MSQATADLVAAVQAHEFHPAIEDPAAYVRDFRRWDEQSQVISAKLAADKVPDRKKLEHAWRVYSLAMLCYYDLADRRGKVDHPGKADYPAGATGDVTPRTLGLGDLAAYLRGMATFGGLQPYRPPNANSNLSYLHAWRHLKFDLIEKRDQIVSAVLHGDPGVPSRSAEQALGDC